MEYVIAGVLVLVALVVLSRWRMRVVERQRTAQREFAELQQHEYRMAHLSGFAERLANGRPTMGTVTADEAELVAAFGPDWRKQFKEREAALISSATVTRGTGVGI